MGFRSIQVGCRQALWRGIEEELFAAREQSPHGMKHTFVQVNHVVWANG
jgi:hypothetical protein